ncbi:MATE family efflux transporter [Virgibacillus alimentarius]|uniref:hypothetical protein n=1 Tax=Virgibacillus alimentarius TaxID=698769 RepID=UPI0004934544|nr:hypothetical protein [Virgibacillus alimentarius]
MDEHDHTKEMEKSNDDLVSSNLTEPPAVTPESRRNDEEVAEEISADDFDKQLRVDEEDNDTEVNSVYGWIGIALSVISFFMMPIILGGAGIILGFISRSRGADALGNTAIAAGAISILITLFVIPFV